MIGLIAWQDTLRSDAKVAIERLNDLGIQSIMLTGDNPRRCGRDQQQNWYAI